LPLSYAPELKVETPGVRTPSTRRSYPDNRQRSARRDAEQESADGTSPPSRPRRDSNPHSLAQDASARPVGRRSQSQPWDANPPEDRRGNLRGFHTDQAQRLL